MILGQSNFQKHKVLSVHGIIVKNAMTLVHRIRHFPSSLPPSIVELIPSTAPTVESDHISAAEWLATFSSIPSRSSLMYKGPLLARTPYYENTLSISAYLSLTAHKIATKHIIISQQAEGEDNNWPNFLLHNVPGLRQSNRTESLRY